jgi:hypothetical protein
LDKLLDAFLSALPKELLRNLRLCAWPVYVPICSCVW